MTGNRDNLTGWKLLYFHSPNDLTVAKKKMLTFAHAVRYESLFLDWVCENVFDF
jgi:hypothetical protein